MKSVLVIINPVAGTKNNTSIASEFRKTLSSNTFWLEIKETSYAGHAKELVKAGLEKGTQLFVAVGGDGTVHEIGQELIGTKAHLAIIPCGSGNGLARHLNIPLNRSRAIEKILDWKFTTIDTGVFNGFPFMVTAGIGLEAEVAKEFKKSTKRGFFNYARLALKIFNGFEPFEADSFNKKVINITVANSNQWGNNSLIAPLASLKDGKLDICHIEPMSIFRAFYSYTLMIRGKINDSSKYHYSQNDKFTIQLEKEKAMQVDGEFIGYYDCAKATINPASLKVLI